MSNRYVIEGIIRDIRHGHDVALIGPSRLASRHTFLNVLEISQDDINAHPIHTIHVSSGREEIRLHSGGRVQVFTLDGLRGTTPDTIVILEWEQTLGADYGQFRDNHATLAAYGAELIQA